MTDITDQNFRTVETTRPPTTPTWPSFIVQWAKAFRPTRSEHDPGEPLTYKEQMIITLLKARD